jgi:hypothetical protein
MFNWLDLLTSHSSIWLHLDGSMDLFHNKANCRQLGPRESLNHESSSPCNIRCSPHRMIALPDTKDPRRDDGCKLCTMQWINQSFSPRWTSGLVSSFGVILAVLLLSWDAVFASSHKLTEVGSQPLLHLYSLPEPAAVISLRRIMSCSVCYKPITDFVSDSVRSESAVIVKLWQPDIIESEWSIYRLKVQINF